MVYVCPTMKKKYGRYDLRCGDELLGRLRAAGAEAVRGVLEKAFPAGGVEKDKVPVGNVSMENKEEVVVSVRPQVVVFSRSDEEKEERRKAASELWEKMRGE